MTEKTTKAVDPAKSTPVRRTLEYARTQASSPDEAAALRNLAKDLEKAIGKAYAEAGISTKK